MKREDFVSMLYVTNIDVTTTPVEVETEIVTVYKTPDPDINAYISGQSSCYIPKAGDKILLLKDHHIPQVKLREWCKRSDVRLVKSREDADVIIIGGDYIDKSFPSFRAFYITKEVYGKWVNSLSCSSTIDIRQRDLLLSEMNNTEVPYVVFTGNSSWVLTNFSAHGDYNYGRWVKLPSEDTLPNFAGVSYHEDSILSLINEGATVIDEEICGRLSAMFKSEDSGNWAVAMEIMANSDYVKSAVYLMSLCLEFKDKIFQHRNHSHVNFTAMKTYLGINYRMTVDSALETMVSKKLMTKDSYRVFMDHVKRDVNRILHQEHFIIGKITLSESGRKLVKESCSNCVEIFGEEKL